MKEPYTYEDEDGDLVVKELTTEEFLKYEKKFAIVPNEMLPEQTISSFNVKYGTKHTQIIVKNQ